MVKKGSFSFMWKDYFIPGAPKIPLPLRSPSGRLRVFTWNHVSLQCWVTPLTLPGLPPRHDSQESESQCRGVQRLTGGQDGTTPLLPVLKVQCSAWGLGPQQLYSQPQLGSLLSVAGSGPQKVLGQAAEWHLCLQLTSGRPECPCVS